MHIAPTPKSPIRIARRAIADVHPLRTGAHVQIAQVCASTDDAGERPRGERR